MLVLYVHHMANVLYLAFQPFISFYYIFLIASWLCIHCVFFTHYLRNNFSVLQIFFYRKRTVVNFCQISHFPPFVINGNSIILVLIFFFKNRIVKIHQFVHNVFYKFINFSFRNYSLNYFKCSLEK